MNSFDSPIDLAQDLMEDVRSLGLISQNASKLKAFSHQVLTSVTSIDAKVQISQYSGTEFLDLISQLNQAVAPYLQQQAKPTNKLGPIHIWVIAEADRLSGEQQSIIFRLIELFPALPFRVIWLSSAPLQAWQDHANSESLLLDLDAAPPMDETDDLSAQAPDPLDSAVTEHRDMTETATSDTAVRWPTSAASTSTKLKVAAALAVAAILGALAWMMASAPSPSKSETKTAATAATAASATTVAAPAAVAASEAPSTATEAPVAPTAALPASETAAAVAAPAAVTASAPQVSEAPKPEPAPAPKSPPAAHKALPEMARTGGRWLKALPADTLVVEHGSFNSLEQAQKLQAKHKELGMARIIAVRKTPHADDWQYSVVTGPFRSEERAKTYIARLDWRAGTRIRGTDKLKPLVASAP